MLEIEKLDMMLTEAGIDHMYRVDLPKGATDNTYRTVWIPGTGENLESQRFSVIQHDRGSYGCENGLCEIWDLKKKDPYQVGHTAEECFEKITEALHG